MKIAIISDTHDRDEPIKRSVDIAQQRGADLILHCGDIEGPEVVWLFPAQTHFVFGNCDGDRLGLRQAMRELGATLHEPYGFLELAGKKLAFVHGDDRGLLRTLETSGTHDYVCHGHTHVAAVTQLGPTCIINPGALHRVRTRTFALLNLPEGTLESIVVE